jgi:hypothetical protein
MAPMNLLRIARFFVDVRLLLACVSIAIVMKLLHPQAFSWLWIGGGLIVWFCAASIIVTRYFDELSRSFEP